MGQLYIAELSVHSKQIVNLPDVQSSGFVIN